MQTKYLDSAVCGNTMLDPAQLILSPDQFDNKDYSGKWPLEVRSSIRDFANALHPNNLLHQGGVGANSTGFDPAHGKTVSNYRDFPPHNVSICKDRE